MSNTGLLASGAYPNIIASSWSAAARCIVGSTWE
jgi:hypothetical protein